MSNYEITIQVDMRETEQEVTQGAQHSTDGRFRIVISRESGQSIDHCEQAVLAAKAHIGFQGRNWSNLA